MLVLRRRFFGFAVVDRAVRHLLFTISHRCFGFIVFDGFRARRYWLLFVVVLLLDLILPPEREGVPPEREGVPLAVALPDIAPEFLEDAELEVAELPIEDAELSVPIALELAELSVPIAPLPEAALSVAVLPLSELPIAEPSLEAALSAMPAELSAFALLSVAELSDAELLDAELSVAELFVELSSEAELAVAELDRLVDWMVEASLSSPPLRFISE